MDRRLSIIFAAAALSGCVASGPIKPIQSSEQTGNLTDEEARLWVQAEEFDAALENSGRVFDDPQLNAYLQGVMDRVFPELKGTIRVEAVDSPELNAFALPNGSIYINTGLLARMENEAQLASVLAHEGGHFIHKHGLQQQRNVKSASAFAIGTAIVGIPFVGDLVASSSIYGFSRELETEADRVSFDGLQKAGYDHREGAKVFSHLAAEAEALDIEEPVFFSSHPRLKVRIENFNAMSAEATSNGKRLAREAYLSKTRSARLAALQEDCAQKRHASLMLYVNSEVAKSSLHPHERYFYLGEAHRMRGEEGDADKAVAAYHKAVKAGPKYSLPYRALGLHYMKSGDKKKAQHYLQRYIALAPKAQDRGYMEFYLSELKK